MLTFFLSFLLPDIDPNQIFQAFFGGGQQGYHFAGGNNHGYGDGGMGGGMPGFSFQFG